MVRDICHRATQEEVTGAVLPTPQLMPNQRGADDVGCDDGPAQRTKHDAA